MKRKRVILYRNKCGRIISKARYYGIKRAIRTKQQKKARTIIHRRASEKIARGIKRGARQGVQPRKRANVKRQDKKGVKQKIREIRGNVFNLCLKSGRESFYERIKADKRELRDKLSEEQFDDIRIIVDIGYDLPKKKKHRNQGHRIFKSLTNFKRFLALDYKYTEETGPEERPAPLWTKRGVCKYNKRGHLSVVRRRGDRILGERILKYYKLIS